MTAKDLPAASTRSLLNELRSRGLAVTAFTPGELGANDPRHLEGYLASKGNEWLECQSGEDVEEDDEHVHAKRSLGQNDIPFAEWRAVGTCGVCQTTVRITPNGTVCENGHGGAPYTLLEDLEKGAE